MNWISGIMLALILSCLTGSMVVILWKIFSILVGQGGNARYLYFLLRGIIIAFIFPLLSLTIYLGKEMVLGYSGALTLMNHRMNQGLKVCFFMWIAGMAVCLLLQVHIWFCYKKATQGRMLTTLEKSKLLATLCEELHIKKKIRIYQGYGVYSPFIAGILHPSIYLPMQEISTQDLEMILYHELTHYKQRDVLWKPLFGFLHCVYWFNPILRYHWQQMNLWAEASCDAGCCNTRFHTKEYFELLLEMCDKKITYGSMGFAPMWCEGSNELKWRIGQIKRLKKRTRNVTVTVTLAMISLLVSGISTKVAIAGMETVCSDVFWSTAENVIEEPIEEETDFEEHTGTLADLADTTIIEQPDDGVDALSNLVYIDWTLKNNETMKSSKFSADAGGKISISVIFSPDNKSIKMGIIEPGDTIRYITENNSITHTFKLTKSGRYQVFATNKSGSKVTITGSFIK